MALPGVESVERQGAPPRSGSAGGDGSVRARIGALGAPPALLSGIGSSDTDAAHVAPADSYALRLVATRRLYDAGSSVTGSPSLTPLVPPLVARANPYDLDRLGATTGDRVRVRSARGELVLPAEADPGVPRGAVAVDFNVPVGPGTPGNAVATLIDSRNPVTEVRLESV
jgi:anaerobic selenocysteine-containing dehydrogenase